MTNNKPEPRGHYVETNGTATADAARGHYYKKDEATVSPEGTKGHYTDVQEPDGTIDDGEDEGTGHYVDRSPKK